MRVKNLLIVFQLVIVFIILSGIGLTQMAASEVLNDTVINQEENITNNNATTLEEETCPCGREIYHEDGPNYSKYDCVKCRKNMYLCTCACWCGAPAYWETSINTGSITLFCRKCNLPCSDCICADKAITLLKEQQQSEGKLSTLDVAKPKSIINTLLLAFFIIVFLIIGFLFLNFSNKPTVLRESEKIKTGEGYLNELIAKIPVFQTKSKIPAEKKPNTSYKSESIIKWPILGEFPAISAYELSNNILYKNRNTTDENLSSLLGLIKDYLLDIDNVKRNSLLGEYGELEKTFSVGEEILKNIDDENEPLNESFSEIISNSFWDTAENSMNTILGNDNADKDILTLPFNNTIKIGNNEKDILTRLKNINSNEIKKFLKPIERFPEMTEMKKEEV